MINFQNIQAAHTTQYQKNKQSNQKVGNSGVFSNTTVRKHQFFGAQPWGRKELDATERLHFHFQPSLWSSSHTHT